jgi:hypothetical protein
MKRNDIRALAREVEFRLARTLGARLPSDRWAKTTPRSERPRYVKALAKMR